MSDLNPHFEAARISQSIASANSTSFPPFVQSAAEKKIWEASKRFESMFLSQMFKAMRRTIHHSEISKPSKGREIFTEFLDNEYARQNTTHSETSLAADLYRQLMEKENQDMPLLRKTLNGTPASAAAKNYHLANLFFAPKMDKGFDAIITEASKKFGVSTSLIKSVIQQESGFKPTAISKAGAKGLMQLMDGTAKAMGVKNVYDPRENILGGTRYLKYLSGLFGADERKVLAAYNAGPGAVRRYGGIPPFKETQTYVKNVLNMKRQLDNQKEGGGSE